MRTHGLRQPERRGSVIVLAALCLVVVVAFLAFSVDIGYVVVTECELQNAADAGALSGARALPDGKEAAVSRAYDWAHKNIAAGQNVDVNVESDIELGFWDEDTAHFQVISEDSTINPNAVRVICRRDSQGGNPLPLLFARILGTEHAELSVSCIAMNRGGSCGGIMALNRVYLRENSYTDSYNSDLGDYYSTAPGDNGDVCTNGHVRLIGYAGINGDAHPGPEEDGVEMGGDNYVTGDTSILEDYIDFPPVNVGTAATANDNNTIPLSSLGNDPLDESGALKLGGAGTKQKHGGGGTAPTQHESLTLAPGTYYLSGLELNNGATLHVSGQTYIYVNGDVNLTGGGIVNETRIPMKLQIYPLGSEFWLPNDVDLHAVIYSTTSAIEKAGGAGGFFGKMVGQKIKINGSGGLHVDDSAVFGELASGGEQLGTSTGASIVQ